MAQSIAKLHPVIPRHWDNRACTPSPKNTFLGTVEQEEQELNEQDPWGLFLTAATFAKCSELHPTLKSYPRTVNVEKGYATPDQMQNWLGA